MPEIHTFPALPEGIALIRLGAAKQPWLIVKDDVATPEDVAPLLRPTMPLSLTKL
jgi:hypothetical protein